MKWQDPFNRTTGKVENLGLSRVDRVRLLSEAAEDLISGKLPSREAIVLLAGGLRAYLTQGGDLLRDYWRIKGSQGSTHTPAVLLKRLQEETCSSRRATAEDEVSRVNTSQETE